MKRQVLGEPVCKASMERVARLAGFERVHSDVYPLVRNFIVMLLTLTITR